MTQSPENIIQRIQQIRKLKQHSVHDCATILGIADEQYLRFEEGTAQLTLPEIELLSLFLGVPLLTFFNESPIETGSFTLLIDSIQPLFIKLRHKMIRAKLAVERELKPVTVEEIQEATAIPLDTLQAYENGESPIPLHHLWQICDFLAIPIESFFNPELTQVNNININQDQVNWQPEFPAGETNTINTEEDPYQHLINAMKRIPKEYQVRIAKILLNGLKKK